MTADLDLNALRFRPADLPGFDPVGLWMELGQSPFLQRGIWTGADDAEIIDPSTGETWTVPPSWCASAASASTRDRLARWCAERLKVWPVTEFPPALLVIWLRFRFDSYDRKYVIDLCFGAGENPRHYTCPAWDGFEPGDMRTLPDGSRWVEDAALVHVAKRLGGDRG